MQIGAKYPLTVEWSADDVRRYALDAEAAGVDFVSVAGHVLSSAPGRYPERPDRLYVGPNHPHAAQQPQPLDLAHARRVAS